MARYDKLAQALFIDMFGDPVQNPKGWEVKSWGRFVLIFWEVVHHQNQNQSFI